MEPAFQLHQPSSTDDTHILSVTEVSQSIKKNLEGLFPFMQVQGEISNFRRQASGHLYFSLKDAHAQISCVMFKGYAQSLKSLPKEGDQVILSGSLSVYLPRGNYQVIVQKLQLAGLGEKLAQLEELKKRLKLLGYFEPSNKKPLPNYPKVIGIVTSPTGAALQDMLNILRRRAPRFHIILNPVKVQGEGAAEEIAQAVEQLNEIPNIEVIIVARGGGSIEDLWAFNEEVVAHAIFRSSLPVISAVGHEIDHTLSDFVADLRAPTPSAAAELVLPDKKTLLQRLDFYKSSCFKQLNHLLKSYKDKLTALKKQPHLSQSHWLLAPYLQKGDIYREKIQKSWLHFFKEKRLYLKEKDKQLQLLRPSKKMEQQRSHLITLHKRLLLSFQKSLTEKKQALSKGSKDLQNIALRSYQHKKKQWELKNFFSLIQQLCESKHSQYKKKLSFFYKQLQALNPEKVLERGYHIIFSEKENEVILSKEQLRQAKRFVIHSKGGKTRACVEQDASSQT